MLNKFKAALIGCGRIGSEFDALPLRRMAFSHAGAYLLHPRTQLIAACDSDTGKLHAFKKKWKTKRLYSSYRDMLKHERVDILSICTPASSHAEIVEEVCVFPLKAIYCEKPISDKVKDAQRMVKACRQKGILLVINHQRNFDPFYNELKNKLNHGAIGSVQQVNCYYTRGIMNTGVHILSLFSFLFGRVEWVMADYSQNKSPFKGDPNLEAMIKFKNGPCVTLKPCDDNAYLIFEIDILTNQARLRLSGDDLEYFSKTSPKNLLNKNTLLPSKDIPFRAIYTDTSLVYVVDYIVKCLEDKCSSLSSGEAAVEVLRVIDSLLHAARSGKRLFLSH